MVIDTETTGLDARKARIVEIARGARSSAGGSHADDAFRRLVRPGVPIPAAASAIHGIDDATVAQRAGFRRGLAGAAGVHRRTPS